MVKKHDNKGFSMIELIVTIAILAVITGAAVSIFSWIKNNRMRSMAGNVNTAISDTRSKTLTKGGTFELIIKKETSDDAAAKTKAGDYIAIINNTVSGTTTQVSKKKISEVGNISVECGGTTYDVDTSHELHISFNKADGSFKVSDDGSEDGMSVWTTTGTKIGDFDGEIEISYANLDRTVKLNKLTGKHYIE